MIPRIADHLCDASSSMSLQAHKGWDFPDIALFTNQCSWYISVHATSIFPLKVVTKGTHIIAINQVNGSSTQLHQPHKFHLSCAKIPSLRDSQDVMTHHIDHVAGRMPLRSVMFMQRESFARKRKEVNRTISGNLRWRNMP